MSSKKFELFGGKWLLEDDFNRSPKEISNKYINVMKELGMSFKD